MRSEIKVKDEVRHFGRLDQARRSKPRSRGQRVGGEIGGRAPWMVCTCASAQPHRPPYTLSVESYVRVCLYRKS